MAGHQVKSRRRFITDAALLAGGIFVASGAKPFGVLLYATERKNPNGPWYGMGIDLENCIGCRYCVQACPYGCRYIDPVKKVADKCTLCYHRIMKGMLPACVEVCPGHAKIFGDLNDPKSELVRSKKEHSWQVLKPHMNTDSKVYYNGLRAEVR